MAVVDFYNDVRGAIGRGASIDARLPIWSHEALNQLETEYTFMWMRGTYEYALVPGANSNRVALALPNIKAFNWTKFGLRQGLGSQQTTAFGREVVIVDPRQIVSIDLGYAGNAYIDGVDTLVLDALPQEACTLFVNAWVYSTWPVDTTKTLPVLTRNYAAFKSYFMLIAAANLRDQNLAAIWSARADRGVAAMIAADTDLEWKSRRQLRIGQNS